VTTTGHRQPATSAHRALWPLFICDAAALVASGLIHLHLWDIAYRHVKTLDVLFLVQVAAAILLAIALLVTRHLLVVLASLALMAGTIVGFILAETVGIFGFKLPITTSLAIEVLVIEIVGIILLAFTGALMWKSAGRKALLRGGHSGR
jgi:hypothetical protein